MTIAYIRVPRQHHDVEEACACRQWAIYLTFYETEWAGDRHSCHGEIEMQGNRDPKSHTRMVG